MVTGTADELGESMAGIGVESGSVMTVLGPIPVAELGLTLMHEHIFLDAGSWWQEPAEATRKHLARQPVDIRNLGELRLDPFVSRDNCDLLDETVAIEELQQVRALGGQSLIDPTNVGIGRDPLALQRVSRLTGLQIVMGCGYYLEPSHPPAVATMSAADIAAEIVRDVTEGAAGTSVRAGIIGEIGVSAAFTPAEQTVLRGAGRASAQTGVPLTIHLPGWERLAHRVLDMLAEEGADLGHVVLDHMNPSLHDVAYQTSLADRGAFLEYDMIGMDFFYADQQAQSPSDGENAAAIKQLLDLGYGERLLLSQDVFLKMMLTRYGGWGYAYILRHFVPRLRRHGVTAEQIEMLLVANPQRVFAVSA